MSSAARRSVRLLPTHHSSLITHHFFCPMEIINRIPRMRSVVRDLRAEGSRVGLVPTMGALHEGHLSLMARAREMCDISIASVFVNPAQFGPTEDFNRYPRDLARDAELAFTKGVDYIFA